MSRKLDDLAVGFRPIIFEFLARLVEQRIYVVVVNTLRSEAEQEMYLALGRSWTKGSLHLIGRAIDIAPIAEWTLHGSNKLLWDSGNAIWQDIGAVGEGLGLDWGGRWTQRDMGHFGQHGGFEIKPA